MLEKAGTLFESENDQVELLTTATRIVELLVLRGDASAALERAAAALARGETMDGVSVQVAMLPPFQPSETPLASCTKL